MKGYGNLLSHRLRKTVLVFFGIIILSAIIIILFISPITKYLVEKYDERYTGRQITMDWAYVNPFTGYIHLSGLKIYESKEWSAKNPKDNVFFSASGLSAHFALRKMLFGTYEITDLELDKAKGIIILDKKALNFDDLIQRFTSKDTTNKNKEPVHFNILNIKINDGEFHYLESLIPVNYFIKQVNIESSGKRWNNDNVSGKIFFVSGPDSGALNCDFDFNTKTLEYHFALVAHKYDLKFIGQYLKALMNYGRFTGNIDADISGSGHFNDEQDINMHGLLTYNDFHLGKSPGDDYASFDKLVFNMKEFNPKKHSYLFDSISLTNPFFKYERFDYLDNIQTMFGKNEANISAAKADNEKFNLIIEIARYVKVLVKDFFQSYYKIDRLAIYKGDLKYNDYSLEEKFSMDVKPLYVIADSVDKNHVRAKIYFKSGIEPYGNFAIQLSVNPKDSGDFDLEYHFNKLSAAMFNPYTISYTSFPLNRGTIDMNGAWKVRNGIIQSDNHLIILDPCLARRIRKKDTKWLPLPLIMAFVRENANVIEYQIPITGDLRKPKFHLKDVFIHLFENIFVKPPATPYRTKVKRVENNIENSLSLQWDTRQSDLGSQQVKFIKRIADFLVKNPQVSITVHPEEYTAKEKEYILFFEAKKKYFLFSKNRSDLLLSKSDSERVEKMSVKDSTFILYLNRYSDNKLLFTVQEKCLRLLGSNIIDTRYRQLNEERENTFMSYFKKQAVDGRVRISAGQTGVPFDGFSFYKIDYIGELPENLIAAYREINELNEVAPRLKYKKDREGTKPTFLEIKKNH
jgi:hypothetical protein